MRATLSQGFTTQHRGSRFPSRRYLRCIAAVAEHPRMLVRREPRHILYRAVIDVTQRLGISHIEHCSINTTVFRTGVAEYTGFCTTRVCTLRLSLSLVSDSDPNSDLVHTGFGHLQARSCSLGLKTLALSRAGKVAKTNRARCQPRLSSSVMGSATWSRQKPDPALRTRR